MKASGQDGNLQGEEQKAELNPELMEELGVCAAPSTLLCPYSCDSFKASDSLQFAGTP